jgi:hypothetical protein
LCAFSKPCRLGFAIGGEALCIDNRFFVALIDTTNAMCYPNTIIYVCCIPMGVDINDKSTGALAGFKFGPLAAPTRKKTDLEESWNF